MIATGSKYTYLSGAGVKRTDAYPDVDVQVIEPIRALFRRAIADGSLRDEFSADVLLDLFSGLIKGALDATARRRGIEESAAAVTTLFLHGARAS